MIIAIICAAITFIFNSLGCKLRSITYGPGVISCLIFLFLFYKENTSINPFINPVGLIIGLVCIPNAIFVMVFFVKQFNLVSRQLTYKQYDTISKDNKISLQDSEYDLRKKIPIKERFNNIMNFVRRKRPSSLF